MAEHLPLQRIAGAFVRYANLTFGGGSATIAVLHRELVAKRGWIDESPFGLCYALSRLTPGTNLLSFCTGIGWLLRRLPGAIAALLAASIPCSVLAVILTMLFDQWSHNSAGGIAIRGAMAAVVGITVMTCWTISKPYIGRTSWLRQFLFIGAAFTFNAFLSVAPVPVMLVAAIVGLFFPVRKP
jgi:chromate transporter